MFEEVGTEALSLPKTGAQLRLYRKKLGLRQRLVAEAMGISPGYLATIERRDKTLDPKWVRNLSLNKPEILSSKRSRSVVRDVARGTVKTSGMRDVVLALLQMTPRERSRVMRAVEVIEGLE